MVYYCIVKTCKNSTYKNQSCAERVSWHGLPADRESQQKWSQALGVENIAKTSRICSKHFTPDCFQQIGLSKPRLKSNAVPILHISPKTRRSNSQNKVAENDAAIEKTSSPQQSHQRLKQNSISPVLRHATVKNEELLEISQTDINGGNNALPTIPTKSTASIIRYPGDVTAENILKMSPRTIVRSMLKLKQSCNEKTAHIKRLQRAQRCQLKKIATLQQLLTDLRKSNLISPSTPDMLEGQ